MRPIESGIAPTRPVPDRTRIVRDVRFVKASPGRTLSRGLPSRISAWREVSLGRVIGREPDSRFWLRSSRMRSEKVGDRIGDVAREAVAAEVELDYGTDTWIGSAGWGRLSGFGRGLGRSNHGGRNQGSDQLVGWR
ncbi:hypothetical protein MLD38_030155 [Melastoma candidum]|uniref:Uncharacterized protein n=1 Tax=Melastoma candidum TaxID=119954 RepID=A0ACB9MPD3_9MYRT|nr:hypothetical protein MLD38_030155 [Melastoma candidum]